MQRNTAKNCQHFSYQIVNFTSCVLGLVPGLVLGVVLGLVPGVVLGLVLGLALGLDGKLSGLGNVGALLIKSLQDQRGFHRKYFKILLSLKF